MTDRVTNLQLHSQSSDYSPYAFILNNYSPVSSLKSFHLAAADSNILHELSSYLGTLTLLKDWRIEAANNLRHLQLLKVDDSSSLAALYANPSALRHISSICYNDN